MKKGVICIKLTRVSITFKNNLTIRITFVNSESRSERNDTTSEKRICKWSWLLLKPNGMKFVKVYLDFPGIFF
jgi:hypothetical protein